MTTGRSMKRRLRQALAMLCVSGFAAAASASAQEQDAPALEAELLRLIGDAACTGDEQCRTIGWGAKACGGPQSYRAWSTLRSDEAALKAAAAAVEASQRREIGRRGIASNCSMVVDPGAYCDRRGGSAAAGTSGQGTCQLLKRGAAQQR